MKIIIIISSYGGGSLLFSICYNKRTHTQTHIVEYSERMHRQSCQIENNNQRLLFGNNLLNCLFLYTSLNTQWVTGNIEEWLLVVWRGVNEGGGGGYKGIGRKSHYRTRQ